MAETSAITLTRVQLTKKQLETLSKKDLTLFLGATKLFNDLSIGTRYFLFAISELKHGGNDAETHASFTFFSYSLRMLAGHLNEASKFIKTNVHAKYFREKQATSLQDALDKRIKTFKAHFSKRNIVTEIRDKSSFHTDVELLLKTFEAVADGFLFDIFINHDGVQKGQVCEHLFAGANMLAFGSLLHLPSSDILAIAKTPLMPHGNEVLSLASDAMVILLLVVVYITEMILGLKPLEGTQVLIPTALNYKDVRQPYFFDYNIKK